MMLQVFEHEQSISAEDLRKIADVYGDKVLDGFAAKCSAYQMNGFQRALQASLRNAGQYYNQSVLRTEATQALKRNIFV